MVRQPLDVFALKATLEVIETTKEGMVVSSSGMSKGKEKGAQAQTVGFWEGFFGV